MAPETARRFPPADRLTRTADLEAVRRHGKRFRTPHLEVRYLASLLRHPRVGLIVPKHKQTAVARNRVKRQLRECARLTLLPALRGRSALDVVMRAAPGAYAAGGSALADEVQRIAMRLGDRPATAAT